MLLDILRWAPALLPRRVLAFQVEQVLLAPQASAVADELPVLPDDAAVFGRPLTLAPEASQVYGCASPRRPVVLEKRGRKSAAARGKVGVADLAPPPSEDAES